MDIPYGKVLIYVLTFVGYIYSGYGSGLLTNLRDAVVSAEAIFGDVMKNVIKVAKGFRNLHDFVESAVDEECIFKCPTGAPPKTNRNHEPSADGCGALGLKIDTDYLPVGEMKKCCDKHDICYDTCNSNKDACDLDFKRCLYRYCDGYDKVAGGYTMVSACKGAAKMLFTGTLALGCKAYKDAQKIACYCPPAYGWKDKKNKYTRGDEF